MQMYTVSGQRLKDWKEIDRHFQQNSWLFFFIEFLERCKWAIKLSNVSSLHIYKCKQVRHISTYHARFCLFVCSHRSRNTQQNGNIQICNDFMMPFDNFDKRTSDFRDFEMAQSTVRRYSTDSPKCYDRFGI